MVAKIAHQAFTLAQVVIRSNAFITMKAYSTIKFDIHLVQGKNFLILRGNNHACYSMAMHDARCIRPAAMNGGVNDKPGRVDWPGCFLSGLTISIHNHQRTGGDFLKKQPVRVDQIAMAFTGQPYG